MKLYHVYILASITRVLYIGVTRKLGNRIAEHKVYKYPASFTSQYNVTQLVYFEEFTRIQDAIAREKQLKGWQRARKVALIEKTNPDWQDLAPIPHPGPSLCSG